MAAGSASKYTQTDFGNIDGSRVGVGNNSCYVYRVSVSRMAGCFIRATLFGSDRSPAPTPTSQPMYECRQLRKDPV